MSRACPRSTACTRGGASTWVSRSYSADQGCFNHACIDNPCQAAEESRSSLGCDYWALKTAQRAEAPGAPQTLNAGEVKEFTVAWPFTVKSQDTQHAFYLGGYMT
jgi:hypothetical protein